MHFKNLKNQSTKQRVTVDPGPFSLIYRESTYPSIFSVTKVCPGVGLVESESLFFSDVMLLQLRLQSLINPSTLWQRDTAKPKQWKRTCHTNYNWWEILLVIIHYNEPCWGKNAGYFQKSPFRQFLSACLQVKARRLSECPATQPIRTKYILVVVGVDNHVCEIKWVNKWKKRHIGISMTAQKTFDLLKPK